MPTFASTIWIVASLAQGGVLVAPQAARPGPATQPIIASQPIATRPLLSHIRIDEPKHDYGQVWEGDPVTHTFSLANIGNTPLAIHDVHSTCGCTTVGQWDKTVAPGQTWQVEVKIDTNGRRGKTAKAVIVQTDDPAQASVRLTMEGEIRPRFDISPARSLNFGKPDRVKPTRRTVTITNKTEKAVTLDEPKVDSKAFRAQLRPIEPGQTYELTVETIPPLPEGGLRAAVTIATHLKEFPELVVQVYAYVVPPVIVQPTTLLIPQPVSKEFRRRVALKSDAETPVHIIEAKPSNDAIGVEVDPKVEGSDYEIWLTIPAGTTLSPQGETVTIKTDHAKFHTFAVALRPYQYRGAALVATQPATIARLRQAGTVAPTNPPATATQATQASAAPPATQTSAMAPATQAR